MSEPSRLPSRIAQKLAERQQQGLHRSVKAFHHQDGKLIDEHNNTYLNFSGNDYLGLANDPALISAWQDGLSLYGAGSTASPLVTGFSHAHQALEVSLCDWLGFDKALLFNSGFSANQAVIFSLLEKGDVLFQDKLNHASLMEAGILSEATMLRFLHNNTAKLDSALKNQSEAPSRFVITEGVFSMDGDLSPLADIDVVCRANEACLMVDDAHGIGVLGKEGRGSCDNAGIQPDILIVTFGKAFGMMGAAVMCSAQVHDYLTQFARHYVYSTAMPPAQAYALSKAVSMIRKDNWRREKLHELSSRFHRVLSEHHEVVETQTPIKPAVLGDVTTMLTAAEHLKSAGFWTGAIRPPTVPPNSSRLRITLSVNQTLDDVNALACKLRHILEGDRHE
ncbi:8-amino-7-oxononanoate synthase [Enterovibrio norvegicus]|uniref:8-amino-7-ketopelargonate synthase n=1 Tax=Enterovibrio norvegicus TaxID=188144 RepID=A0A2N7LAD9_9GAMM|nr:8-amino-7-oxononanoate synthase [Enterovibrio norvegicus]PMN91594.1 8-amino-7-oxononanoate synthase [Enterovibrio norvegicus]